MKTLNRILIGTVLLATLFSCQDVVTYNDGYDDGMNSFGAPDVQGIYSPDDTDLQVPLTKGGFGEMIVLVGENLSNVTKIWKWICRKCMRRQKRRVSLYRGICLKKSRTNYIMKQSGGIRLVNSNWMSL